MAALNNIWLIGDKTLAHSYSFLQGWKNEAKNNGELPYIYQFFDVQAFFPPLAYTEERNPLSRLRTVLVEALNENVKLPKYIVIFQDHSLLETFNGKASC